MEEIDQDKARNLFTIKKNQLKMVRRRGYSIEREEALLSYTLNDFLETYIPFAESSKKSLRNILTQPYKKEDGTQIVAYYAEPNIDTTQLGVEPLAEFILEMDKYKCKNGILISAKNLSPSARKKIESLLNYNIHFFLESEMIYDPTEHYFTPEHRVMEVEEQRQFLSRNNLSIDQLPIILTTDIISRYYGFVPGQVIEIKRFNLYDSIVQNSLAYRAVKEDTSSL
jgi:DNA-directed RNA polymerase subunit H (RpoH/RPB5)